MERVLEGRTTAILCSSCASFVGTRHVTLDDLKREISAHLQSVVNDRWRPI
jgi:hypothetical protein